MRLRLLPSLPCLLLLFLTASGTPAAADDWPQWRGPDRNNVSKETGWSVNSAEKPLWRANIGWGYSAPAVAQGRLFIAGYFEDEATPSEGSDRVSCLNAETGAELWTVTYPSKAYDNEHGGGALSTPTVVGETVFVPSRDGEVRALAVEDGSLRWEVDLKERHSVSPGRYGFASSAYTLGTSLVLNASHTVRLDQATGETIWISEMHDANYSTVVEITIGERACLAVFGGKGLILVDAESGETVHTYVFRNSPRNVEGATPLVIGQHVIVSTAYEQGIARVDFSGEEPVELWRNRRMRNKMAGCTVFDGHLYGFDESMLKCLDLEGNELWRKRGLGHGALTIVGDHLLLTTSDGELVVARATPEGYVEESRREVIDGGVFWTAPTFANGRVYVRGSHGDLVCLDHRGAGGAIAAAAKGGRTERNLPPPAAVLGRHMAAAGYDKHPIPAFQMSGKLHNDSLGLANSDAVWESSADGKWRSKIAMPPTMPGFIEQFYDGEVGWEVNPFRGSSLLEGLTMDELRSTGGMRSIFAPLDPEHAKTIGLRDLPRSRVLSRRRHPGSGIRSSPLLWGEVRSHPRSHERKGGHRHLRRLARSRRGQAPLPPHVIPPRHRGGIPLAVQGGYFR